MDQNKIEMVGAIGFLGDPEFALQADRFAFHQCDLFVAQPSNVLRLVRLDQLRLWRRCDQRFRVVDRVLVHRDHQLGGLNLP